MWLSIVAQIKGRLSGVTLQIKSRSFLHTIWGEEIVGQLMNDVVDDRIVGDCFPALLSDCPRLPVKSRYRKRRFLEGKTFDGLSEIHGLGTALTPIDTGFSGQSRQPKPPILSEPPMRCPVRNSRTRPGLRSAFHHADISKTGL